MRRLRVSYREIGGFEHTVEVEANSLYEAVGLAISRFRRCEDIDYEPDGLHEFTVEPREPGAQHKMTRKTFDEWMKRTNGSPRDVAIREKLRAILPAPRRK
jgi:hypothetical protein